MLHLKCLPNLTPHILKEGFFALSFLIRLAVDWVLNWGICTSSIADSVPTSICTSSTHQKQQSQCPHHLHRPDQMAFTRLCNWLSDNGQTTVMLSHTLVALCYAILGVFSWLHPDGSWSSGGWVEAPSSRWTMRKLWSRASFWDPDNPTP